jgi:uncharacterized protein YecT (DUF1311 family)
MNIAASKELAASDAEMNKLLTTIEALLKEADSRSTAMPSYESDASWLGHLKDAQDKWLAYRRAQCEFDTYSDRGGTIRPLLLANAARRLTELRIAELESMAEAVSEK